LTSASKRSLKALDWLNFFLADIRYGIGGFLPVYLISDKWDAAQIGLAMSIPGITGIIFQSPAGALTDRYKHKRIFIVIACALLSICCIGLGSSTRYWFVIGVQALVGIITTIYTPALTAITLGMVGNKEFPKRMGRNETFNHTGNVIITVASGLIGYYVSFMGIFYMMMSVCLLSIIAVLLIREQDIDHNVAREAEVVDGHLQVTRLKVIFTDRKIVLYTISIVLYYFANAAMFPIVAQMLGLDNPHKATLYTAAGITIAEGVMIPVTALTGYLAFKGNRKYIFLTAFLVLTIRGILYTFTDNSNLLMAIQTLDGAGAGIMKVISVVMIADLTKGTGRFNLMQGTVVTAIGIGSSLSDYLTGIVVVNSNYNTGFYFLSAIAVVGLVFTWLFVAETKDIRQVKSDF